MPFLLLRFFLRLSKVCKSSANSLFCRSICRSSNCQLVLRVVFSSSKILSSDARLSSWVPIGTPPDPACVSTPEPPTKTWSEVEDRICAVELEAILPPSIDAKLPERGVCDPTDASDRGAEVKVLFWLSSIALLNLSNRVWARRNVGLKPFRASPGYTVVCACKTWPLLFCISCLNVDLSPILASSRTLPNSFLDSIRIKACILVPTRSSGNRSSMDRAVDET